jgi:hypothetical protein
MLTSSPAYKLALPRSHRRVSRFTVRTPGGEVLADRIPIGSGQVRAQLQSRVTRTATFTASDEWFPVFTSDPLSPVHAIVTIEAGIAYPSGEEERFPVFTGRIYDATRGPDGEVTFRADDLAADVIAADFEKPVNSQPGISTVAEIERLILDGYPQAVFGDHQVTDARVPALSWDDDRGRALDDLATTLEGRWYCLGSGAFVVRQYAYPDTTPVVQLTDGPGGLLSRATAKVTADGAYNSIVVSAERLDGGDPIRVVERNVNPLSPYVYDGDFGRRVKKVRMQTAATVSDAQRVARSQLTAASALTRQWSWSMVPDMTLEPADVVGVEWRDVRDVQVIDSITYPLSPDTLMAVSGRSSLDVTA